MPCGLSCSRLDFRLSAGEPIGNPDIGTAFLPDRRNYECRKRRVEGESRYGARSRMKFSNGRDKCAERKVFRAYVRILDCAAPSGDGKRPPCDNASHSSLRAKQAGPCGLRQYSQR